MKRLLAVALVSLSVSAVACSKDKRTESQPADDPIVDVDVNEAKLEAERQNFIDGARARLDAMNDKIAKMADDASDDIEASSNESLAKLREARDEVAENLDEAKNKSGEEWAQFKAGVSDSLDDLERGYNDLLARAQTE